MAGSFLHRIAKALFGKIEPSDLEARISEAPPRADASFGPIDSNAKTASWFDPSARAQAGRDSIDSNPDTSRWYRRPRYVVPGAAVHRTSDVGSGS